MAKHRRKRQRRGFPYRTMFRWGFLFFFLALIPGLPLMWWVYWYNYYPDQVSALNQSASYRDTPGRAAAATLYAQDQWPRLAVLGIVLFLLYAGFVFFWAGPGRDSKQGTYD